MRRSLVTPGTCLTTDGLASLLEFDACSTICLHMKIFLPRPSSNGKQNSLADWPLRLISPPAFEP